MSTSEVLTPVAPKDVKSGKDLQATSHPEFPGLKTLLISAKRPRSFLERTARELLAGGTDVIQLSALREAIPLCVQLKNALEEKKAAVTIKIETTYEVYESRFPSNNQAFTPGLRIFMRKHPDFKGCRISPGYVSFCEKPTEGLFSPCFDAEPKDRLASVNAGDLSLFVGGKGINKAFAEVLAHAGHSIDKYKHLHTLLLEKSLKEAEAKNDSEIRSVQLDQLTEVHPDLKVSMCRPCVELKDKDPSGVTGAVFISIFKDKFPHNQENNMGMVYVVGPKGSNYHSKEEFIDAVFQSAVNLMTALCDYNGMVRREGVKLKIMRMNTCRVSLFSSSAYRHPQASKLEIAEAILGGMAEGYRHGPAPRINFAYDDDVFRQTWIATTGLEPFAGTKQENGVEENQL